MRTVFTLIVTVFLVSNLAKAQDTLYIYKSGVVTLKQAIADIDSVTFNKSKINVPAIGTEAYGGIVFYVNKETGHGLVVSKHKFAQQFFGPNTMHAVPLTSYAIGGGKTNTESLVASIKTWRTAGGVWADKTAAETISDWSETVNGIVYDDWFLPSNDEMKELYLVCKNKLAEIVPKVLAYDSYQTSSEVDVWRDGAVSCLNFWYIGEPIDPVVRDMAKQLPLGLLAVRAF